MFDRSLYSRPFLGLVTANMFFWMSVNFFLPVLPLYYHSLGMNDHQVGLAIGAFSLGAVLFRLFAGKAVDRWGGRPVFAAGTLLSVASIAAYHVSLTLPAAIAARFLHGAGISGYSAAALTTVTSMHDARHTTEAVAVYTLFTMFGMGIAASSANWLLGFGGMPLVIAAGAAATVLSMVLFPLKAAGKSKRDAGQPLPMRTVVGNPAVYIPTLGLLASNICFGSIMTFLPLLMLSRGVTEFNSFYVAYSVAVIFARLWIGRLCALMAPDRLAFYILALLGLTMLTAGQFSGWWVQVLCGAGLGVGYGLAFPVMLTIITAHIQAANRGTAFGFYTMAVDVGFAAGAIGMGAVAATWGYPAVFMAAGVYTVGYALIYQFWLRGRFDQAVPGRCEIEG